MIFILAIRIKFANFVIKKKTKISHYSLLLSIPIPRSFSTLYLHLTNIPISQIFLHRFHIYIQRLSIRQIISFPSFTFFPSIYYNYTSGRCSLGASAEGKLSVKRKARDFVCRALYLRACLPQSEFGGDEMVVASVKDSHDRPTDRPLHRKERKGMLFSRK